jgi:putative ATP-dependent endonuclease of OLD family
LGEALGIVTTTAQELGVHIGAKAKALLDSHSVSFGGGTISLHNESGIPLRSWASAPRACSSPACSARRPARRQSCSRTNWSTGWSRTASLGSWAPSARRRPLLRCRCSSPRIRPWRLRELSGGQLFVLRRGPLSHEARLVGADNDIQSTIRLYPEAFLAGSVVVCEGASEIGLLRGLDLYRLEQGRASLAALGVPSSTAVAGSRIDHMPAPRRSSLWATG